MPPIHLDSRIPRTHRVMGMQQLTSQVSTFKVHGTFGAKPGQFAMVWIPGVDELPLSIVDDDGEHVTIAFFILGAGTQALAQMKDGDLVGLRGAFGTHFDVAGAKRIAIVGGGYGSAPMLFAAKQAMATGAAVDILLGAKTKDALLFQNELTALKPTSLTITTDDGSVGEKAMVTGPLEQLLAKKQTDLVLACGPEKMLVQISALCLQYGVPAQLSAQRYMKCGYGLCGTCVVDPLGIRMCEEGPVLSNDVFSKVTEFGQYKRDGLGVRQIV